MGVDTHKDPHVARAKDALGGALGELGVFPATRKGNAELLEWARGLGDLDDGGIPLAHQRNRVALRSTPLDKRRSFLDNTEGIDNTEGPHKPRRARLLARRKGALIPQCPLSPLRMDLLLETMDRPHSIPGLETMHRAHPKHRPSGIL